MMFSSKHFAHPWKLIALLMKTWMKPLNIIVIYDIAFSNSLIIHQVKTKKITTMKEVWVPGLNNHRFWRFYFTIYSLLFVLIEKIYQTLKTAFHRLSKHLKFHQKYSTAHHIIFQLSSQCLDILMKHCLSCLM